MSDQSAERRAILRVRWGPMALRKAILERGQVLRVGSDKAMDLALPHDEQLFGTHFELTWDGEKCRIRDLGAPSGTLLDGKPIQEEVVPPGGWIRAGRSDFLMHVERHTPPASTENPSAPLLSDEKRSVLSGLSGLEHLYAVLDMARSDRLMTLLQESVEEYQSLYEGPRGAALEDVAPHLVHLPKGSKLLESLVQEGWGESWGVYLTSESSFTEVRRHLRKFLMIHLEGQDGQFYFRFYDPRVLREFLPVCATDQRNEFFGPLTRFLYEDSKGLLTDMPR